MRELLILFGSETGCAEDVAQRIAREARRRHYSVRISTMDEYDRAQLVKEPLVVFVCSTTGQGEEPTNMKQFWKFLLRKALPLDSLTEMKYAVFGLGDSSYLRFNFPAKKLFKRLAQLGGSPLVPRGDGDDQHYLGVDGALDPWLDMLWQKLDELNPLPKGLEVLSKNVLYPISNFEFIFLDDPPPTPPESLDCNLKYATVLENSRITSAEHFQDVRHVRFDISDLNISYEAGDVMVVYPQNPAKDVQEVLEYFGWTDIADKPFRLQSNRPDVKLPSYWPAVLTLRRLFEEFLDIFGRPRRYFFELLSFFATDPLHADKLAEFASSEGQDELYAYCHKPRRTTFEVLSDFNSVKVPLKYLLDLIPIIRPRSYSISSSPNVHANEIHITVAIVEYRTKLKKPRKGICSSYISTLSPGDRVAFSLQRGTLKLPADEETPIIFLGPGTGVAPIRSLIYDRLHSGGYQNTLFGGFRNKENDYLYGEEWDKMSSEGKLAVWTAFSRDQESKVYIQHKLEEQGELVWKIVNSGGYIILSGNAQRIPSDIMNALKSIFQKHGGLSSEDATKYLAELERKRRYQSEFQTVVGALGHLKKEKIMANDQEETTGEQQVVALTDPINFNIKHPLQHRWTLWFDSQQKKATQANWHDNLKSLITFATVEDFWGVYNNVIKATQMPAGSNYHLFKEGIRPMWEDKANAEGGKWVTQVAKPKKKELDNYWLNTILVCIGESFEHSGEICGAVVSVRRHADRLSLWTKSVNNEAVCTKIGKQWKEALGLGATESIGFQAHSDALQTNSSFSNKDMYTV
ncbi:NADPH-dependent diflavin oxidoreductase 1 [Chytridiales sp. JEL 0842]|nr:NADPH-dependent diflavin oxidoreductase 1 [Chytridiales sp. JEL 0842]